MSGLCIIIAACLVPSVDAVNPGDEGHMSCVRDFMDFATVVQELAMNMPELPATFSTGPRVDYNQEIDTDEFEKALAENAQQVRKEATALERNASDGTGMPDGNASDNDFECGPSASKKHKNTQSSTSTNPNPLHELPPDFEFAVGHTFFCTLNEMKVFSKKWAQKRNMSLVKGDGTDLRNKPKGNKLVLICR